MNFGEDLWCEPYKNILSREANWRVVSLADLNDTDAFSDEGVCKSGVFAVQRYVGRLPRSPFRVIIASIRGSQSITFAQATTAVALQGVWQWCCNSTDEILRDVGLMTDVVSSDLSRSDPPMVVGESSSSSSTRRRHSSVRDAELEWLLDDADIEPKTLVTLAKAKVTAKWRIIAAERKQAAKDLKLHKKDKQRHAEPDAHETLLSDDDSEHSSSLDHSTDDLDAAIVNSSNNKKRGLFRRKRKSDSAVTFSSSTREPTALPNNSTNAFQQKIVSFRDELIGAFRNPFPSRRERTIKMATVLCLIQTINVFLARCVSGDLFVILWLASCCLLAYGAAKRRQIMIWSYKRKTKRVKAQLRNKFKRFLFGDTKSDSKLPVHKPEPSKHESGTTTDDSETMAEFDDADLLLMLLSEEEPNANNNVIQ